VLFDGPESQPASGMNAGSMQVECMSNTSFFAASPMATLQIRDVPDPLHHLLQIRARQHRRSLSQQALRDLQQACGGDVRERRRQALSDLQALADEAATKAFQPSPEDLIRQDRAR
jgi:plasmid stability protein